MNTVIDINGFQAVVEYDPEIKLYRGEFLGLNGGADFYARDLEALRQEGEISLKVFLEMCREDGVAPRKEASEELTLRVSPWMRAEIVNRAQAEGKTLNQWAVELLEKSLSVH